MAKTLTLVRRHLYHHKTSWVPLPWLLSLKCIIWHLKDSGRQLRWDRDRESLNCSGLQQTWFQFISSMIPNSSIMKMKLWRISMFHLRNGLSSKIAVSSHALVPTTHSSCLWGTLSKAECLHTFQQTSRSFQIRQISRSMSLIVNSKVPWMPGHASKRDLASFCLRAKMKTSGIAQYSQFMPNYKELELTTK